MCVFVRVRVCLSPFRALDHLSAMPSLVSTLQEISAYDVTPLLRHLLPHLVHTAFTPCSGKTPQQDISVESVVLAHLWPSLLSYILYYMTLYHLRSGLSELKIDEWIDIILFVTFKKNM